MANPKHVDILMQGVEVWNKWREENPEIKPDLSWLDQNSEEMKSSNIWISESGTLYLPGINLARADLQSASFDQAFLVFACMENANLNMASFGGASLQGTDLTGADLTFANLSRTFLWDACVAGATLNQTDLTYTYVAGVAYSRLTKCHGIRVDGCFGSQMFKTFAQDQDYLEEYREKHPILYWLWYVFADCGRSFWPWALWSLIFAVLFAALYYGVLGPESFHINGDLPPTFMTMTYYSVVTFTTLGFGDLTPATTTAAVFVMFEVVLGYIMLGGLISILANKLARRA